MWRFSAAHVGRGTFSLILSPLVFDQSSQGQACRPVTWDTHLGTEGQWKIKWVKAERLSGLKPKRADLLGKKEGLLAPSIQGWKYNLLGWGSCFIKGALCWAFIVFYLIHYFEFKCYPEEKYKIFFEVIYFHIYNNKIYNI